MTKHKMMFLITLALALVPNLGASALPCAASGNLATLEALGSTGCTIDGILFDNFSTAMSASGTGLTPTPTQVSYSLDNGVFDAQANQAIYGFEFNPNLSVLGIGSEDVQLAYDITAPKAEIGSIHLLETSVSVGAGSGATVAEGPDYACTGIATGCVFLPTLTVTPANPHQDLGVPIQIGPYETVHVFKDINVVSNTSTGISATSNVRDSIDLTSTVPDPATLSLVGFGLIFLSKGRRLLGKGK